jgi:hypothetical protein
VRVRSFLKEFTEEAYRTLVEELETVFENLTFDGNFKSDFRQITIGAGQEVNVPHRLKVVPKYRIIVRQSDADALITDGASPWTDSYITLKNQGASETTITVLILRE